MTISEEPEPTVALHVVSDGDRDRDDWQDYAREWLPLQDQLFRIALLVGRDRSDAEDAVADAMAATFRPWREGRVQSLDAYARRAVVNALTGRGRRRAVADRFGRRRRGDDRGTREVADEVVDHLVLRRALAALPPRQRAVVALRYLAGLSVAEVADTLGCSEGTVKSQTHDALASLRSSLGTDEEGGR